MEIRRTQIGIDQHHFSARVGQYHAKVTGKAAFSYAPFAAADGYGFFVTPLHTMSLVPWLKQLEHEAPSRGRMRAFRVFALTSPVPFHEHTSQPAASACILSRMLYIPIDRDPNVRLLPWLGLIADDLRRLRKGGLRFFGYHLIIRFRGRGLLMAIVIIRIPGKEITHTGKMTYAKVRMGKLETLLLSRLFRDHDQLPTGLLKTPDPSFQPVHQLGAVRHFGSQANANDRCGPFESSRELLVKKLPYFAFEADVLDAYQLMHSNLTGFAARLERVNAYPIVNNQGEIATMPIALIANHL
jgi:hypothetical protein